MKYKKYVAILALLSITTSLSNDVVYASNVNMQQRVVTVQETKEQKQTEEQKHQGRQMGRPWMEFLRTLLNH